MLTKSCVKIGITKHFVTTTKCLVLSTKRLVAAAKFLVAATKKLYVVPNFVAVTKPFFLDFLRLAFSLKGHNPELSPKTFRKKTRNVAFKLL